VLSKAPCGCAVFCGVRAAAEQHSNTVSVGKCAPLREQRLSHADPGPRTAQGADWLRCRRAALAHAHARDARRQRAGQLLVIDLVTRRAGGHAGRPGRRAVALVARRGNDALIQAADERLIRRRLLVCRARATRASALARSWQQVRSLRLLGSGKHPVALRFLFAHHRALPQHTRWCHGMPGPTGWAVEAIHGRPAPLAQVQQAGASQCSTSRLQLPTQHRPEVRP